MQHPMQHPMQPPLTSGSCLLARATTAAKNSPRFRTRSGTRTAAVRGSSRDTDKKMISVSVADTAPPPRSPANCRNARRPMSTPQAPSATGSPSGTRQEYRANAFSSTG